MELREGKKAYETDLLSMPKRCLVEQKYKGIRGYCFTFACLLESSPLLYYVIKTIMGTLISVHLALSSFFLYQKVILILYIVCKQ